MLASFCRKRRGEAVGHLFQEVKREKWRKDRREREKGGAVVAGKMQAAARSSAKEQARKPRATLV